MPIASPLDPVALFNAVEQQHGLQGLADGALRRRFNGIVQGFNEHGHWAKAGEAALSAARAQIERRVLERLKLERDLRQYPEIAREQIERPIFVVGYGRTGTTIMHCLLGEDPNSRMPEFWEALTFSPPPGLDPDRSATAIAEGDRESKAWTVAIPNILRAHPYWDMWGHTPIEDEEIFSADFYVPYPTHYYRVPFSPLDTAASDPAGGYQFLRTFLQYRQWRMPSRRWVCKGVMHQAFLDKLLVAFPDALCVWTHRDPVEYIASTFGIYTALYDSVIPGGVERPELARRMLQAVRGGYDYILSQPWIDDPRVVHVRFRDFIADPVRSIAGIYERAGLTLSAEHETGIRRWLAENKADRHGKFTYSYDGYGITAGEVRALFADYTERFGLQA